MAKNQNLSVSEILDYFQTALTPQPVHKPVIVPVRPEPVLDMPTYDLPFGEKPADHETIFSLKGDNPVFLRPNDIERLYGIPASTVYDWIHAQPETHFPAVKLVVKSENKRRMVLIPKRLLDEWIVEHSTLMKNKPVKGRQYV